ncbi:acyl-CoA/acyl-ACP dehydrogenase [Streptosporangiaceae bacterium NEAU-GS5]|nr:acyl-CoA/acyl-ACP dehydrogenase [Streptosporangiaceae bacterium NEAU-GS5]
MNLLLSAEQQDLRAAVRSFLSNVNPRDGYDPAVYGRMNGELGLAGLVIPDEYGGAGGGISDLSVVLVETGAALLPGPFLATTLATLALLECPDKELLSGIAEGRINAALAWEDRPLVLGGMEADVLILVTGEPSLVAVEGFGREPVETIDITRGMARVSLDGATTRVLGRPSDRVHDLAMVAIAAEQLGVLRESLAAIVSYAKVRVAFGRFIGSYQGVKHKLADMHCALEQAESLVRHAAWTADAAPDELPLAAALAQAYVGRACFQAAKDSLLLHGGIGFTWEHDAHLYFKRAKSDEVLLGPPRLHRSRLAALLGLS